LVEPINAEDILEEEEVLADADAVVIDSEEGE
jgi:hypothetical protein